MTGMLAVSLGIAFSSLAATLLVGRRNVAAVDAPRPPLADLLGGMIGRWLGWAALVAGVAFALAGLGGEQALFVLPLILSSTFLIAIFAYRVWPGAVWLVTAAAWLVSALVAA